jgi:FkbM family methyltransferase
LIETRVRGIPLWVHEDEDLSNAIKGGWDFWEGDILDYIRDNFSKQSIILDIGANIGNHTVYFATYLDYIKIVAFEPLKRNYKVLLQNIQRFSSSKLLAYERGLSDHEGWTGMTPNVSNLGASEIHEDGSERVYVQTVDSVAEWWYAPITLLKIDVEWHEPQVLKGAEKTIQKHKPLILIEDTKEEYGKLLPDYEMIMAWKHHNTFLYRWKQ